MIAKTERPHTVNTTLNSVIFMSNIQFNQNTVSGTKAIDNPKDRAILSIESIDFLLKNRKLQQKPGTNKTNIPPNIIRNISNTLNVTYLRYL